MAHARREAWRGVRDLRRAAASRRELSAALRAAYDGNLAGVSRRGWEALRRRSQDLDVRVVLDLVPAYRGLSSRRARTRRGAGGRACSARAIAALAQRGAPVQPVITQRPSQQLLNRRGGRPRHFA